MPVPGRMQAGESVGGIGDERAHEPDRQKTPSRIAQPARAPQVGEHGQDQDVAEGIGGGRETRQQGTRTPHRRADQEYPRQQSHTEGDDQGVEKRRAVSASHPGPIEHQQADRDDRVHRYVDRIDEGRERDVLIADELMPRLVDRVPGDEQQHPDAEAPPRHASFGAVPMGAVEDGRHRRQPQHGPGRHLPRPLHPRHHTEDPRVAGRYTEGEVDETDERFEPEEPHPDPVSRLGARRFEARRLEARRFEARRSGARRFGTPRRLARRSRPVGHRGGRLHHRCIVRRAGNLSPVSRASPRYSPVAPRAHAPPAAWRGSDRRRRRSAPLPRRRPAARPEGQH